MRKVIGIVVLLVMWLSASAFGAQWVPLGTDRAGAEPVIRTVSADRTGATLEVQLPGFYVSEIDRNGRRFQRIEIPGGTSAVMPGTPNLPRLIARIGLPDTGSAVIDVTPIDVVTLDGYTVEPVQLPTTDLDAQPEFIIDETLYGSTADWPLKQAEPGTPAIWRDVRISDTSIYPLTWKASTRELKIAKKMKIEIRFTSTPSENEKIRTTWLVSRNYDRMYRASIVNYDAMGFSTRNRDTNIRYIMIAADSLIPAIQPLADWWNQAGVKTVIRPISEVGTTTDAVKAEILEYYNTENTEYVLLVGETNQVPIWSFSHSGDEGVGDFDYSCLEGGDWVPEIAIGRILHTDPDTVSHIVARTLNYISNPPDDGWLERTMLAAHEEEYPGKYTQCKNEIKNYSYAIQTPVFDTYYPPEGQTHAQVVAAMVAGRGLINYRGHGDNQEWSWSLGWVNSDIHSLANGTHTPIVLNICCNNAWIDSASETLSEAWQNAGASGEGGAVGNIGASRPSYTVENHDFDKEMFKAIFDDGITRFGDAVNVGKTFTSGMSSAGQYNSRIYFLFGDPALDMSTNGLFTMDVEHLPTVPIGGSDYMVTVTHSGSPVENAMVCIRKGDELFEVGYTDSTGHATLPALLTSGGMMDLTITAHNYAPFTDTIIVEAIGCGAIMMDHTVYNCDQQAMIRVWDSDLNVNPAAPDTSSILIHSDSEPVNETVTITETGPDTGEFRGYIQTSSSLSGPGFLLISHEDSIVAQYNDANCEGAPRVVTYTATADCDGPQISGLTVSGLGINTITISWTTEEVSDTVVTYGISSPPSIVVSNPRLLTDHSVTIDTLEGCTEYFFEVSSTDGAGNIAVDDNGGSYYQFTTLQLVTLFSADMNSDPGWTYQPQWAFGQPTGSGGDPSSGFTGDNVVGYNLSGAYGNSMSALYATTNSFDCSGASQAYLSFQQWLGVESATYDHATVEISTNGGTSWNTVWSHAGGSVQPSSWTLVSYDISSWAAGQGDVKLRWGMGPSDSSVVYCGWNIDDVSVTYTTPCNVPLLVHGSHVIDDSMGNNDGEINAGESILLSLTLDNQGIDATGIEAQLITSNPHVTITQGFSAFPDIPQSGEGTSNVLYAFTVSTEATDGETIPFTISWTSSETSGSSSFAEMIVAPALGCGSPLVLDADGDIDGILDPGETASIMVTLSNTGNGAAHDVSATLTSDQPSYITINDDTATFPDITGGGSEACEAPYYNVSVDPSIPDHTMVTFTLDIDAEGYTTSCSFMLEVTSSDFAKRIEWNMDSDPGWTADPNWAWGDPAGTGGDPQNGYTGTNVYGYNLSGTYENNMTEKNLTSTVIDCSYMADVEVRFQRWLGVESASYDHAAFKVSSNGSTWTTIWNHTGSTLNETAWSAQTFDISAIADGQPSVYLRWTMGTTDSSLVYCGWNLDDVSIWARTGSPADTPTPAPPTNTPTITPTRTVTRTPTITPTVTPTRTPTPPPPPTNTPTITPTSAPTHDPTPTTPPSATPTADVPTATPTTGPGTKGMELIMTDPELSAGEEFYLHFYLHNPDQTPYDADVYLLLGVYGNYWCWPSWQPVTEGLDYRNMTVGAGQSVHEDALKFDWPAGVGSAEGLAFYGCPFEPGTWTMIGDVQVITWSYM